MPRSRPPCSAIPPPPRRLRAAILGGSLAAGSHFAKAGSRAVINTSPEPFSNWAASFGEELAVGTVLWLAFAHPLAALVVLVMLVAFTLWLISKVARAIRALLRKVTGVGGGAATKGGADV